MLFQLKNMKDECDYFLISPWSVLAQIAEDIAYEKVYNSQQQITS